MSKNLCNQEEITGRKMAQKYNCRNSTNRWLGNNLINYSCLRLKQQARGGGRGRRTLTWRPADSVLGEGGHGKGEAGGGGARALEVSVSVPEVSGRYNTNP